MQLFYAFFPGCQADPVRLDAADRDKAVRQALAMLDAMTSERRPAVRIINRDGLTVFERLKA